MGVVKNEDPLTKDAPTSPAGCENFYLADILGGSYQLVTGSCGEESEVVGASTDLSHIVFQTIQGRAVV